MSHTVMYKITQEGSGASAARKYEKDPSKADPEDKSDAFAYYMANMKFVEAEHMVSDASKRQIKDPCGNAMAVGMLQTCRGDYERAVASFGKAEACDNQDASYLRILIACQVLGRADDSGRTIEGALAMHKYNESAPAAKAIIAYCQLASDGRRIFDDVTQQMSLDPIFTRRGVLESYVALCRKFGKSDEINKLRNLYETNKGPLSPPKTNFSEKTLMMKDLGIDVEFQTAKTVNDRYHWLHITQGASGSNSAWAARHFEEKPSELKETERFSAFAHYIWRRQFVQAESLIDSMTPQALGNSKGRGYLALGIARLCRGDYERAVDAFALAERLGSRTAAWLRVYISSLVFFKPEEVQDSAKRIVDSHEFSNSRLAAAAILAYCQAAKDGDELFQRVWTGIDKALFLDDNVVSLCWVLSKKLKRTEEMTVLRPYLDNRLARILTPE